ncbi:MAG: prepilin-type N-terminal cleavage/methylation domain-containing protein, partial [Alphaproteobacteria bacterium]
MHNQISAYKKAFTLVELSIVLIIIGLIIGGITYGSALINQSQILSVIGEITQYRSAVNNFALKYNSLPGDITNASTFWPSCDSTPANCNGNGDGTIGIKGNTGWQGTYQTNEALRAWQHLNLAGIISGNYSGIGISSAQNGQFSVNSPASKYNNSGYSFYTENCYNIGAIPYLMFGGKVTSGTPTYSVTPMDAYNIDNKLDDGNPKTGKAIAPGSDIVENCGGVATANACVDGTNSIYYFTK